MNDNNDVATLLGQLDAGVFAQKIEAAFSNVGLGVAIHGKKGRVLLSFDFSRVGESTQVEVTHKLVFVKPTERGSVREENTTSTPLHVGSGGKLTILETTGDLFRARNTEE